MGGVASPSINNAINNFREKLVLFREGEPEKRMVVASVYDLSDPDSH